MCNCACEDLELKKAARDEIKKHLERERDKLRYELRENIYAMKQLVSKQTITKRKITEYTALIRHLDT